MQLIIIYLSLIFVLRGLEHSLARLILIYDSFCKKDVRDIGETHGKHISYWYNWISLLIHLFWQFVEVTGCDWWKYLETKCSISNERLW